MDDQYLLGPDLWIAPVLKPNVAKKEVYLPDSEWNHLWTGRAMKKGKNQVNTPRGYPAVFYRFTSSFNTLFETIHAKFK